MFLFRLATWETLARRLKTRCRSRTGRRRTAMNKGKFVTPKTT